MDGLNKDLLVRHADQGSFIRVCANDLADSGSARGGAGAERDRGEVLLRVEGNVLRVPQVSPTNLRPKLGPQPGTMLRSLVVPLGYFTGVDF